METRQSAKLVDDETKNAPVVREDIGVFGAEFRKRPGKPRVTFVDAFDGFVVAPFVKLAVRGQHAVDGHFDNILLEVRAEGFDEKTGVVEGFVIVAAHIFKIKGELVPNLELEASEDGVFFLEHVVDLRNLFVGAEIGGQIRDREQNVRRLFIVSLE